MVAAIKQLVTVQPGGVVQVRSAQLRVGAQAEVIVLLPDPDQTKSRRSSRTKSNGARGRKSASREVPIARMTKQVRGDIAWAKSVRQAIRQGREKLIPWEQVKRELGLE